jgi:hypothetical protein
MTNIVYPRVSDAVSAKRAARQGVILCSITAVATTVSVGFTLAGLNRSPVDPFALIDAGIFVLIAIGISRMSRTAAVLGAVFYFLEAMTSFIVEGAKVSPWVFVLSVGFMNSVRGTFAYYRLTHAKRSAEVMGSDARKAIPQVDIPVTASAFACEKCGTEMTFEQSVCVSCGYEAKYT